MLNSFKLPKKYMNKSSLKQGISVFENSFSTQNTYPLDASPLPVLILFKSMIILIFKKYYKMYNVITNLLLCIV